MSDLGADHRTYAHAAQGYDNAFEQHLTDRILKTITEESRVTDVEAIVLRTGESIGALARVMAMMLAMTPHAAVPSRLREAVDQISKRVRRDAARMKAAGVVDILGGGQFGGHA
jgi:hypothetical protein